MIKFKQKEYTIQEGHYTGPKDLEKIPGSFEVIGKATIGGAASGGVIGGVLEKAGVENSSISTGITTGGKTGFLAGIAAKLLLNALHKPMKTVKYQEVDKLIRSKFGIYRLSGFTTGDSLKSRQTIEEKYGFNDRKVTDYKISFCIRDNQVTMYTLGISDEDLDKLNLSLDYFCKKFSGMSYNSKPINTKTNSYSVSITFTNYKAVADFIIEVSERLGYKINLLNDNALLERQTLGEKEEEERSFSFKLLDKYDQLRILGKSSGRTLGAMVSGPKAALCTLVTKLIWESLNRMSDQECAKMFPSKRKNLSNVYLRSRLKDFGYIEGVHYTEDLENCECNIRLDRGLFIVTSLMGSKPDLILKKLLPEENRKEVKGKVNIWSLYLEDRGKFDILLQKMIGAGVRPNIFNG